VVLRSEIHLLSLNNTNIDFVSDAKVMSYEDLVEARAKRAEKDARKIARKQRRKRSGGQEVVPDAMLQVPLAAAAESANGQLWMAEAQYAVAPVPPCPGAAPIARMW
jgi:hypothetical protein